MPSNESFQSESPHLNVFEAQKQTGRLLCTPQMIEHPDDYAIPSKDLEALQQAHQWVEASIFKVVEKFKTEKFKAEKFKTNKSQKEAVCPFARPAMDAHLLFYSVGQPENPESSEAIADELRLHRTLFQKINPQDPSLNLLRSIILVLPETPHELILKSVDLKHSAVKTELLEAGIMIGEFFKDCPFPATWDDTIFPLQSPIPFYALRPFIESDWRFIHGEKRWREIYKNRFGEPPQGDEHKLPARARKILDKITRKSKSFLNLPGEQ